MANPALVSVLIPTYNYAHYLDEAIQSVLNQTYKDFELIIVDDQSKDNTDEVVGKYLHDDRVFYYKNETNLGLVGNFNKCLEYANGEYIKYLLADDKFHPQILAKFVSVMEQYPKVTLVTSHNEMFGEINCKRELPFSGVKNGKSLIHETIKGDLGNWIGEPTVVMFRRKDILKEKFNNEFLCLVDLEMWFRLLSKGDCYIIPEVLSYFRTHSNQVSRKIVEDFKFTFEDYKFYKTFASSNRYGLDLSVSDTAKLIRRRAIYCANAMFRVLPRIYKKESLNAFRSGFKIGLKEGVINQSLSITIKALLRKALGKRYYENESVV